MDFDGSVYLRAEQVSVENPAVFLLYFLPSHSLLEGCYCVSVSHHLKSQRDGELLYVGIQQHVG